MTATFIYRGGTSEPYGKSALNSGYWYIMKTL